MSPICSAMMPPPLSNAGGLLEASLSLRVSSSTQRVKPGDDVVGDKDSQETHSPDPAGHETEPSELLPIGELRGEVPAEIRDVSFPGAVRGYDRRAVDAYVKRVNRVIAELEVSRSPQAAIRHALDRVGQQTTGVLQRAREVADELAATALAESEHTTARARVEAEELLEEARMQAHQLRAQSKEDAEELISDARQEAAERLQRAEEQLRAAQDEAEGRLRDLQARTAGAAGAHRKVLEELRAMAAELQELASEKSARLESERVEDPAPDGVGSEETIELPAPVPAPAARDAKVRRLPRSPRSQS
jgi:DivIVA domain-containing protein